MSRRALELAEERKLQLATQAAVDRLRVTLAVVEIRSVVAPHHAPDAVSHRRPLATLFVAVAAPIFGFARVARFARLASILLMALRIARAWHGGHEGDRRP